MNFPSWIKQWTKSSCFLCPPPRKKPLLAEWFLLWRYNQPQSGQDPQDTPEQLTSSTPASKMSCEHFSLHCTLEKQEQRPRGALEPPNPALSPTLLPASTSCTHTVSHPSEHLAQDFSSRGRPPPASLHQTICSLYWPPSTPLNTYAGSQTTRTETLQVPQPPTRGQLHTRVHLSICRDFKFLNLTEQC